MDPTTLFFGIAGLLIGTAQLALSVVGIFHGRKTEAR